MALSAEAKWGKGLHTPLLSAFAPLVVSELMLHTDAITFSKRR